MVECTGRPGGKQRLLPIMPGTVKFPLRRLDCRFGYGNCLQVHLGGQDGRRNGLFGEAVTGTAHLPSRRPEIHGVVEALEDQGVRRSGPDGAVRRYGRRDGRKWGLGQTGFLTIAG